MGGRVFKDICTPIKHSDVKYIVPEVLSYLHSIFSKKHNDPLLEKISGSNHLQIAAIELVGSASFEERWPPSKDPVSDLDFIVHVSSSHDERDLLRIIKSLFGGVQVASNALNNPISFPFRTGTGGAIIQVDLNVVLSQEQLEWARWAMGQRDTLDDYKHLYRNEVLYRLARHHVVSGERLWYTLTRGVFRGNDTLSKARHVSNSPLEFLQSLFTVGITPKGASSFKGLLDLVEQGLVNSVADGLHTSQELLCSICEGLKDKHVEIPKVLKDMIN